MRHGAQNLFGWFGGYGIEGTGGCFDSVGLTPGKRNALIAGLAETGGELAIALGETTGPAGAALLAASPPIAQRVVGQPRPAVAMAEWRRTSGALGSPGSGTAWRLTSVMTSGWNTRQWVEPPNWK